MLKPCAEQCPSAETHEQEVRPSSLYGPTAVHSQGGSARRKDHNQQLLKNTVGSESFRPL